MAYVLKLALRMLGTLQTLQVRSYSQPLCVRPCCPGHTPLHLAARAGHVDVVNALRHAKAQVQMAGQGCQGLGSGVLSGELKRNSTPSKPF